MAKVIGVCGIIGTGKDTVARFFEAEKHYTVMSLADPLKIIIQDLFEISTDVLWGPSPKRTGEVRRMLQLLGTDFARSFDSDVWVKKLLHRTSSWMYTGKDTCDLREPDNEGTRRNIIVPDVRFPNEAEALVKVHNAKIIKLTRSMPINPDDELRNHASETEQENIPESLIATTIENSGTVDDLWEKLRNFCQEQNL